MTQGVLGIASRAPGVRARFDGAAYAPRHDDARLHRQLDAIFALMRDGVYRTYAEISEITGAPEGSVSAQLRNLKKPRFGAHKLLRRVRGERSAGLYEYRLIVSPAPPSIREQIAAEREAIRRARERIARGETRIRKLEAQL